MEGKEQSRRDILDSREEENECQTRAAQRESLAHQGQATGNLHALSSCRERTAGGRRICWMTLGIRFFEPFFQHALKVFVRQGCVPMGERCKPLDDTLFIKLHKQIMKLPLPLSTWDHHRS